MKKCIGNGFIFTVFVCSLFLFINGCASTALRSKGLKNESGDVKEGNINYLLQEMQTSNGDQKDVARTKLLNNGKEAIPYLAAIFKNLKASQDLHLESESMYFNKYGVWVLDANKYIRDDYAGGAAVALAQIGGSAIPILVEIIKDKRYDFQYRWRALVSFEFMEKPVSPEISAALISCLTDDSPFIRSLAASAIGRIGGLPDVPELSKLLNDSNPAVKKAAKDAIQKLGNR